MARPKVLVVAEGQSEIGDLDQLAGGGSRRSRPAEGYIPPMIRKLLGQPVQLVAQRVTRIGRADRHGLKGHADRAAKALALAAADGCTLLVFVKDVDREPGRKKSALERKTKLASMHAEIESGFDSVDDADRVARVKATPCRMIEAWALGDPNAIGAVGKRTGRRDAIPKRPEELWGDESDPNSSHPKCVLRRVVGGDGANSLVFEQIAREAAPDTLRKSCPESFAPFADEMSVVARALSKPRA